jgi:rod shape-determining protein MreD
MVDPVTASRISYRLLYVALAVLVLFLRVLPLSAMPSHWPGPDLILCLTFVWLLRRADYLPALVIVAVFAVDDLVSMRPPGLWTLIALVTTEFIRSREVFLRDLPFALEWAIFAAAVMVMTVSNRLILDLFMVPQSGFDLTILEVLSTLAAYPVVVLATVWIFGLRRAVTGQIDALGHRI